MLTMFPYFFSWRAWLTHPLDCTSQWCRWCPPCWKPCTFVHNHWAPHAGVDGVHLTGHLPTSKLVSPPLASKLKLQPLGHFWVEIIWKWIKFHKILAGTIFFGLKMVGDQVVLEYICRKAVFLQWINVHKDFPEKCSASTLLTCFHD